MAALVWVLLISSFSTFIICNGSVEGEGNIWAVLVAAYDGFEHYGVEAAIYKTYQILRNGGVPAENIIVFSPDEVAYNTNNPYMGTVFYADPQISSFTEQVYIGRENIDYAGKNNTVNNFLAVLSGNKAAVRSGSKRVLQTEPDDTVLISFIGRGGTGVVAFPQYRDYLFADDFLSLLEDLQADKVFHKVLITFDASASGSNFDNYLSQTKYSIAVSSVGRVGLYGECLVERNLQQPTVPCFNYNWLSFAEWALRCQPDYTIYDVYLYAKNSGFSENSNLYGNLDAAAKTKITTFYGKNENACEVTYVEPETKSRLNGGLVKDEAVNMVRVNGKTEFSKDTEEVHNLIATTVNNVCEESISGTTITMNDVLEKDFVLPLNKFKCYRNIIAAFHDHCVNVEDNYVLETQYPKLARLSSLNIPEEKIIQSMITECKGRANLSLMRNNQIN